MTRSLPTYPVINPAFTPVVRSKDRIEFRAGPWSGPMLEVSSDDGGGGPTALVEALDGETTAEEVIEAADRGSFDAKAALERLVENRIVVEATAEPDLYFNGRHATGDESVRSLLAVGDGRGVARLVADLTTLERVRTQLVPVDGTPSSVPSSVEVGSVDGLGAALDEADFVVSITDRPRPSLEERLNELVAERGVRWTRARIDGYDAVVGPTVVPDETACFECYRRRRNATIPVPASYRRHVSADGPEPTTLPEPFASLVAGLVGVEIRNQLREGFGVTCGRLVQYDLWDLSVEVNDVLRMPRCPVCRAGETSADDPRHATLHSLLEELGDRD